MEVEMATNKTARKGNDKTLTIKPEFKEAFAARKADHFLKGDEGQTIVFRTVCVTPQQDANNLVNRCWKVMRQNRTGLLDADVIFFVVEGKEVHKMGFLFNHGVNSYAFGLALQSWDPYKDDPANEEELYWTNGGRGESAEWVEGVSWCVSGDSAQLSKKGPFEIIDWAKDNVGLLEGKRTVEVKSKKPVVVEKKGPKGTAPSTVLEFEAKQGNQPGPFTVLCYENVGDPPRPGPWQIVLIERPKGVEIMEGRALTMDNGYDLDKVAFFDRLTAPKGVGVKKNYIGDGEGSIGHHMLFKGTLAMCRKTFEQHGGLVARF